MNALRKIVGCFFLTITMVIVSACSEGNRNEDSSSCSKKSTSYYASDLIPFSENGKCGYKIIIDHYKEVPEYEMDGDDTIIYYHEEYTAEEKIVIEPQFDAATYFEYYVGNVWWPSHAIVKVDGKLAYIDETGKIEKTIPQSDYPSVFRNGLIAMMIDGKWGYLDQNANVIIEPQYDYSWDFADGMAAVKIDGKWGYIDTTGKMIIKPQYARVSFFSEGLAAVTFNDYDWGYIDKTGKMVIKPQFKDANRFSNGFARIRIENKFKFGYIDKTGRMIAEPQFDLMSEDFHEGLAAVTKDGKWGYIDTSGNVVIEIQYDYLYDKDFRNGYLCAEKDGKSYKIDKTGKVIDKY